MKKIIALILCIITIMSCIPVAFADNAAPEQAEEVEEAAEVEAEAAAPNLEDVTEAVQNSASSAKRTFIIRGAIVLAFGCFVAFVLPNIASKLNKKKGK